MSNAISAPALNIGTSEIRQIDGLYSLNDLHVASGGDKKYQPSNFIRSEQTQSLIAELNSSNLRNLNSENPPSKEIKDANSHLLPLRIEKGRNGGTYACKELVIAYAAWISPAFHLKVIRVFLAQVGRTLPESETITKSQQGELATLITERFPSGKDRPYAWSRFNNHFRLASYKDLPANRFDEAYEYIKTMQEPVPALPKPKDKGEKSQEIMQQILALKDESVKAIAYACIEVLFFRTKQQKLREAEADLLAYFQKKGGAK